MRLKASMTLVFVTAVVGLMASVCSAVSTVSSPVNSDPITGEWNGLFQVDGYSAELTFKLKLDGNKVIGTAESAHTGPGTLSKGSWADNKLSFTMDFAAHESIVVSATLKDGKLAGEFRTEGMVGKWEAKKK